MTRSQEIESIVLTEDQIKEAVYQYKIALWFKGRSAEYWDNLEKQKPNKSCTANVVKNQKG
jgi:hypothetical protein